MSAYPIGMNRLSNFHSSAQYNSTRQQSNHNALQEACEEIVADNLKPTIYKKFVEIYVCSQTYKFCT